MNPTSGGPLNRSDAIDTLQNGIDRLSLIAAYLAAGCLGSLTLMTLVQVALGLLSKIDSSFPSDIKVGWEYSAYMMGTAFMLGGGLTLRAGMQIRVELLLRAFGGRLLWPLELLSSVLGAGFLSFLAWNLSSFAFSAYSTGAVSVENLTPLWVPEAAFAVGTTIFALQAIMQVIACVLHKAMINESFKVASTAE